MRETPTSPAAGAAFHTTRWSVVAAARPGVDEAERRRALATLCEAYWYPVYAFARRRTPDAHTAADRVQGFFARLLETDGLGGAEAERGRFRTWLLACYRHHESNLRAREGATKRGGGVTVFSLDSTHAEERFRDEPATDETPERVFERAWARTLLEHVLVRLRGEYEAGGRGEVFARLESTLTGGEGPGWAAVATELGISEGAVKVAAHRLRRRFGELLRLEIAQTVGSADGVEEELRGLFAALAGPGNPGEGA